MEYDYYEDIESFLITPKELSTFLYFLDKKIEFYKTETKFSVPEHLPKYKEILLNNSILEEELGYIKINIPKKEMLTFTRTLIDLLDFSSREIDNIPEYYNELIKNIKNIKQKAVDLYYNQHKFQTEINRILHTHREVYIDALQKDYNRFLQEQKYQKKHNYKL